MVTEVPVRDWFLLRLLLKAFHCYICKNMASSPGRCQNCKAVFCQQCIGYYLNNTHNVCPNCCEKKTAAGAGKIQFFTEKEVLFRAKLIKRFNLGWTCRNKHSEKCMIVTTGEYQNRKHEHSCEHNEKCPDCEKKCDICFKFVKLKNYQSHKIECERIQREREEKRKAEEEERKRR